jgi:hypothetical protein
VRQIAAFIVIVFLFAIIRKKLQITWLSFSPEAWIFVNPGVGM